MKNNIYQSILKIAFFFTGIILLISTFASLFNPTNFPFFSFVALFLPVLWIINTIFLLLLVIIKSRLVYTNYEIVDFGWLKQELEDTYALWCDLNIGDDTIKLINVQLQSIRLEEDELESMTTISKLFHLPNKLISIYSKLKRGFVWREEQVRELKKLISKSDYLVILCGDFNDPPSSFTYRQLSKLLNDAFLEKGSGFGFTYAGKLPFLRIDYVMVDKRLGVSLYDKINTTYSDHYPVRIDIILNP